MIADFEITFTGLERNPRVLLRYAKTQLYALTALLTMDISNSDRKKYKLEREQKLLEISNLKLEIQELENPSQLLLF